MDVKIVMKRFIPNRSALRALTLCALLGSVWWIIPVTFQSRYGADFLSFIEQPQTIWAT